MRECLLIPTRLYVPLGEDSKVFVHLFENLVLSNYYVLDTGDIFLQYVILSRCDQLHAQHAVNTSIHLLY